MKERTVFLVFLFLLMIVLGMPGAYAEESELLVADFDQGEKGNRLGQPYL